MRHARPDDLGPLDELLASLRGLDGLVERSPGTFYRRSKAFLHFHVDPAGLFADLKVGDEFERHRVTTKAEQRQLLEHARRAPPLTFWRRVRAYTAPSRRQNRGVPGRGWTAGMDIDTEVELDADEVLAAHAAEHYGVFRGAHARMAGLLRPTDRRSHRGRGGGKSFTTTCTG